MADPRDGFVGISLLLLVFGVFAAPVFGAADANLAERLLGLSLVLFVSGGFVLVGHYNLYCEWRKEYPREKRFTPQEGVATGFAGMMLIGYSVWRGVSCL